MVENAAIALGEVAYLLTVPGRLCENGRPVPLAQPDWAEYTQQLIDGANVMLVAARARDQEAASDATNDVVESCSNCHFKYRDVEPNPRCVP